MTRSSLETVTTNLGKALGSFDSRTRDSILAECEKDLQYLSLSVEIPRAQRKAASALLQFVIERREAKALDRGPSARAGGALARPQPGAGPQSRSDDQPKAYEYAERFSRMLASIEHREKSIAGSEHGRLLTRFVDDVLSALRQSQSSMRELNQQSDLQWFLCKAWAPVRQTYFECVDRGAVLPSKWLEGFVSESWLTDRQCALLPEIVDGLLKRCEKTAAVFAAPAADSEDESLDMWTRTGLR